MITEDKMFISDLKLPTTSEVNNWEHKITQELLLNLKTRTNLYQASNPDKLADTTDSFNLYNAFSNLYLAEKNQLIATLAEKIAKFILDNYLVKSIPVSLKKPSALA